jgi:hypothetical protein
MVFNSAFAVVVSFFMVEDLGDGVEVGLGFFPTSFSLRVFLRCMLSRSRLCLLLRRMIGTCGTIKGKVGSFE